MAGALKGITVLDLSWGVAGPMTGMLLADQDAVVTKVDPPGGDPFESLSGYRVWQRSKKRLTLDLAGPAGRDALLDLARTADVLLESFEPGTTQKLRIDWPVLQAVNPRLVYCSITGYGSEGRLASRPGYDALVAARTGQQWEARGIVGGTVAKLSGTPMPLEGVEAPDGCGVGPRRPGPLFGGLPWVSLGAFYLASLAVSAALRVRELTGRGQWVQTSLLQGALATCVWPWQRVEKADTPGFQSWVIDSRAPKGFFRCSDDRWIHQWTPLPSFVIGAAQGERLGISEEVTAPREAPLRIGLHPEEMTLLHHFVPQMAEAATRFSSEEWTTFAASVGVPLQPVRSPEEALDDEQLLADGCLIEVDDPELGLLRQVGRVYSLSLCPPGGEPQVSSVPAAPTAAAAPASPLEGVLVLDLGLAAAGPFGAQMLADLGADVIKINQFHDGYWLGNHIGMGCNRGKRSIALDLKKPEGLDILHQLVRRADVVHHNMRYEAAERLGVDYESLEAINPALIYCHTRGFERGPRDALPANDQTGAALTGVEWMDGGLDHGGTPIWPVTSLGDTGNGMLSAVAVVQALYHRDRTGQGQYVDTSIMYAHLLNTSFVWKSVDGRAVADRPKLDAQNLGWGPLYRLYETADGWLCLAVVTPEQWSELCAVVAEPTLTGPEFATAELRRANAGQLSKILEAAFLERPAQDWFDFLDARGIPCEVTREDSSGQLFDDPELHQKGWIATYQHPVVGQTEVAGLLFDLSETPGRLIRPAPLVGQHSREILAELGLAPGAIDRLLTEGAVAETVA